MITEPFSFTGRLSLEDVLDLHRYHSRFVLRPGLRNFACVFAFLFAALPVTVLIYNGVFPKFDQATLTILVVIVAALYFPAQWLFLDRLWIRRNYKIQSESYPKSSVTFTQETITVTVANGLSEVGLAWGKLAALANTPRGLLFLLREDYDYHVWFWLPDSVFEGNESKVSILKTASEYHVPIRVMK